MILESLKQLGQTNKLEETLDIDVFIEPLKSKNSIYILFLKIKEETNNFTLEGLDYEEYSPSNNKNWLYKRDKSNINKYGSPTIKLNHGKLLGKDEKEMKKEAEKARISYAEVLEKYEKERVKEIKQIKKRYNILKNISEKLREELEKIKFEDIIEKIKGLDDKKGLYFLSIKINDAYPYDYSSFKEYFKSMNIDSEKEDSSNSKGICFLCNIENPVVGDYFPFGFYNKDKKGFFSNLKQENMIYAFPICNKCKTTLESGKRIIENPDNHLNHQFYKNIKYFILPASVTGDLQELMIKIKDYSKKLGLFSILSSSQKREENEKDLLEFLADMENDLSFSIFFYEEPQGRSFRILKTIEQRLPSDFNKINQAKKEIERSSYFKELKNRNQNLCLDRDFFIELLKDSEDNLDMNLCLSLFADIFYLKKPEFLQNIIFNKIKNTYIKLIKDRENKSISEIETKRISLYLLVLKKFFESLSTNEVVDMPNINDLSKFVKEGFINDTQRAAFVLGMMIQLLLKTQRKTRGSEPFLNRLSEFRITVKKIKELAPEAISKLKWYSIEDSSNGQKINDQMENLNSEFSKYAVNIDKETYQDITEISFAFILGMGQLDKLGGN